MGAAGGAAGLAAVCERLPDPTEEAIEQAGLPSFEGECGRGLEAVCDLGLIVKAIEEAGLPSFEGGCLLAGRDSGRGPGDRQQPGSAAGHSLTRLAVYQRGAKLESVASSFGLLASLVYVCVPQPQLSSRPLLALQACRQRSAAWRPACRCCTRCSPASSSPAAGVSWRRCAAASAWRQRRCLRRLQVSGLTSGELPGRMSGVRLPQLGGRGATAGVCS